MTRDASHYYVFDSHLDDSHQWEHGEYTCHSCGLEFIYTCRIDRAPSCPRCVDSRRWERRNAYVS